MTSEKEIIAWPKVKAMKKFHQRLIGMLGE